MHNKGVPLHNRSAPPSFDELLKVEREREKREYPDYNQTVKHLLDILESLQNMEPELDIVLAHQHVLARVDSMITERYAQYPFEGDDTT